MSCRQAAVGAARVRVRPAISGSSSRDSSTAASRISGRWTRGVTRVRRGGRRGLRRRRAGRERRAEVGESSADALVGIGDARRDGEAQEGLPAVGSGLRKRAVRGKQVCGASRASLTDADARPPPPGRLGGPRRRRLRRRGARRRAWR